MKAYIATCVLRNGTRLVLPYLGTKSADAILAAFDLFGDSLLRCSAKPAP